MESNIMQNTTKKLNMPLRLLALKNKKETTEAVKYTRLKFVPLSKAREIAKDKNPFKAYEDFIRSRSKDGYADIDISEHISAIRLWMDYKDGKGYEITWKARE